MDLAEQVKLRLGARIVKAARLAVAVHLYESVQDKLQPRAIDDSSERRIGAGGAGPVVTGKAYGTRLSF